MYCFMDKKMEQNKNMKRIYKLKLGGGLSTPWRRLRRQRRNIIFFLVVCDGGRF